MIRTLVLIAAAALLAACAAPLPPVTWLRLPVLPGSMAATATTASPMAASPSVAPPPHPIVWQLMSPVGMPGHLDHDALLLPREGGGVLQAQPALRWAEPLRDVVPRLLRLDLARSLGADVWSGPLPPGVRPTHQLRVELLALDVLPGRRGVTLHARFSVADAFGRHPPRAGQAVFDVTSADTTPAALVDAHREALARLAARIAAFAGGG
ncbi:MAG: membrane integrity-associated transporter subunit PqiC [Burkholderiaceae bacterium]|nr:MAG: membrane integrity-associated transporter subunit PqiC [Burkholderiaceae bacterium]